MKNSMEWGFLLLFLFIINYLLVHIVNRLLGRNSNKEERVQLGDSLRSIYLVFFLLATWSCLTFLIPMSIEYLSFLEKAEDRWGRFILALKLSMGPLFLLSVYLYGQKRNFLIWIRKKKEFQDESD